MYVAIKTTVVDRILDRLTAIRRENREPEYVVVSNEEYAELRSDPRVFDLLRCDLMNYKADAPVMDLTYKVYDFMKRGSRYGDRDRNLRAYSREKFMGIPLVVVPAAYVPV